MVLARRFLLMIQFFTTIPLKVNLKVSTKDFGKGLVFAPLIGLIIGGILFLLYSLINTTFPRNICAIVVFVCYIILTGSIHLDGLGDTFDALFSNRSKERILEIMRDSRVGTNAVIAIVSVVLVDIAFISAISEIYLVKVLILMPVAGRLGSLISSGISTYARDDDGLGKAFINYCGVKEIIIGIIISISVFLSVWGVTGFIIFAYFIIFPFILTKLFSNKIDGVTGDILGAVCEISQAVFLIIAYLYVM